MWTITELPGNLIQFSIGGSFPRTEVLPKDGYTLTTVGKEVVVANAAIPAIIEYRLKPSLVSKVVTDGGVETTSFANLAALKAAMDAIWIVDVAPAPPVNSYTETSDPTADDDETEGFSAGSKWYNSSNDSLWECLSAEDGAASWVKTGRELSGLTVAPGISSSIGPLGETPELVPADFMTAPATGGVGSYTYTIRKSSDRLTTSGAAGLIITCADLGGTAPTSVLVDIVVTDEIGQQIYRQSSVSVDDNGGFCGF